MTLADVTSALGDLVVAVDAADVTVSSVAYDSRRVSTGAVFVALKGLKADGLDFVPQALAQGASLVVSE